MTHELIASFGAALVFTLAATGTPGPNNMLLTASGAQFGLKKSLPFWLGIRIGTSAMLLGVAAGLGELLNRYPNVHLVLQVVAAIYLLYLAWKISKATLGKTTAQQQPLGVIGATLFQFLNPKIWATSLASVSAFSLPGDSYWPSILLLVLAWNLTGSLMNMMWIAFGVSISKLLHSARRQQWFARGMGGLTAATVVLIFW
ncbi:LysE family translocator [Gallaecimonas mangrovi]|uniref:LysE family translocator n=1 Tax=Gallaecimonas mangrovi TaxID=2291597 RepID=UPI000E2016EE|nr:LysE family translocator [Gallaecimonas mangrovi]